MALTKIGASLGGGADTISVTQSSHGLLKGRAVKVTGNGTYGYAKADTAANAEAIGIIIESDWDGSSGDNTQLLIALSGKITVDGAIPTGNLTAGTVVFLSATSNTGELTSAEPTTAGHISKPMGVITYLNSEMIMIQQRGEVLSSGGAVLADEYVTNAKLSHMAANTVKVRDANSSGDPSDKAVADTQILIGDGTGFTAAALSGDVTMANDGAVTIANNAVENAMMADDAIGVAELNTTSGTASSSTFLRGDMQWQTPASVPSGAIIMWHGLIANIPSGWVLCNGSNSTPDLRGQFVQGAANGVEAGGTGGSATAAPSNHSVTQPSAHAALASHSHGVPIGVVNGNYQNIGLTPGEFGSGGSYNASRRSVYHTLSYGSGGTRTLSQGVAAGTPDAHSGTAVSAHSVSDSRPPFYTILYIMKT